MRKVMMMVALVALLVALFAGAVFAKNFQCTRYNCEGTRNQDTITEREGDNVDDNIFGRRSGDLIDAAEFNADEDLLHGNRGNDLLDARDGDGEDELNGGPGTDECFGDAGDVTADCEDTTP
jgi:Ca2+-binding RTX toxin-like protein